jgi:DNA end-binding protein Ku
VRSILNTTIQVGIVQVPVKVFSAVSSHDRPMNQFHAADGGRIRYEKVCEIENEPVDPGNIRKGYETSDGDIVLLEDEDFATLPEPSSKTIDVVGFLEPNLIDPIHYEKAFYLGPGERGTNAFMVLRDAMVAKDRVALAMFTLRSRETMAVIRPYEKVLVLDTLLWADEIRIPDVEGTGGEVDPGEMELARLLIDARTGDWEPERYQDEYQLALDELIEAKAQGREAPKAKRERRPKVTSIMDALERSVAEIDPGKLPPPKKAARKSAKKAAKRTPRTAAAKKTAKAAAPKRDRS